MAPSAGELQVWSHLRIRSKKIYFFVLRIKVFFFLCLLKWIDVNLPHLLSLEAWRQKAASLALLVAAWEESRPAGSHVAPHAAAGIRHGCHRSSHLKLPPLVPTVSFITKSCPSSRRIKEQHVTPVSPALLAAGAPMLPGACKLWKWKQQSHELPEWDLFLNKIK